MTDKTATLLVLTGVIALIAVIVGLAVFLWYAAALSRVFARRGVEPWRAWVPVLNEAEILRLGGRPAWGVVFFFIPVVCLYAVVLRGMAAHRISATFGRGAGSTVLAVLLPPVWATVLASTRDPRPAVAPQSGGAGRREAAVRPDAPAQTAAPSPVSPVPVAPPAPVPVAGSEPAATAIAESDTRAPSGPPPASEPVPTPEPVSAPEPPPISSPFLDAPIASPVVSAPEPEASDSIRSPFLEQSLPDGPPEPLQPVEPTEPPQPVDPVDSVEQHAILEPGEVLEQDDEAGETIVVERPVAVAWSLVTDDGVRFPLEADVVVLGRRPAGDEPGVQYLAVPDTTRTLSKQHACLTRQGDGWTVADLDSTNGVFLEQDGRERRIASGESTELNGRLLLGSVGLRLEREESR